MKKANKEYYLDYYRKYPEDRLYGHYLNLRGLQQNDLAEVCYQVVLEKGLLPTVGESDG